MRVLHVRGAQGRVGGIESFLFDLAASEKAASRQVTCAFPLRGAPPYPIPDHARALGLDVRTFPMASVYNPLAYAQWAQVMAATRPEVVHLHDPRGLLLRSVTRPVLGAPAVMTLHGWDPKADAKAADLNVRFLKTVDRVVVGSSAEADAAAEVLGGSDRVAVIPPGVDSQRFRPDVALGSFLKDMRIPQGAPVVGYVARLNGDRQPGDFLRAAVRIQQRHPDAYFCAIGDGKLRAYLDAMEPARALGPRIRFSGHRDDMPQVYPALSVAVVTWAPRAVPRAVLELMAAGVPVVGPRVPALEQVIEDGVHGVLVKEGNFQLMAVRAAELLADRDRARAMATEARRRVEADFSLAAQSRRYLELYDSL